MFLFAPGSTSLSSAATSGSAGSDIPGYEQLFGWSFSTHSDNPGVVSGSFFSNPLLGLNDTAITRDILARFRYDAANNDYLFNPAGLTLAAQFAVPQGVTSGSITTSVGSEVNATTAAPEPVTSMLIGIGLLAVGVMKKARGGEKVR
jgi:hypothetical protein